MSDQIDQFEVMQETIRVLQGQRNEAFDKLTGVETNNRLMVKRIQLHREAVASAEREHAARLAKVQEEGRAALMESEQQNIHLASVVKELESRNEHLDKLNVELRAKIEGMQKATLHSKRNRR